MIMKFKSILAIAAVIAPVAVFAQAELTRTIPVARGQRINMHFDYPDLVRVSTWDKNEISVQGTVSINNGENDDAFIFESTVSGNLVDIRSGIRDMKSLPQRITVVRDGQKMMFANKEELRKYREQHGAGYDMMSWGVDIEIELDIKVPLGTETRIESVYGMVEVKDFNGPLTVEATYGGVDAALAERATGEITAETNYGEIYTNLDVKFGGTSSKSGDFHTFVSARPGTGPRYSFESKYGNVYLRKAVN